MHPWKVTAGWPKNCRFCWQRKEKIWRWTIHPPPNLASNFIFFMDICWYLYIFFCGRGIAYTLLGRITYPHISPTVVAGGDFWVDDLNTTSPGKTGHPDPYKKGKETNIVSQTHPCSGATPLKFNIAREKWWLEDYFPIRKVTFQGLC